MNDVKSDASRCNARESNAVFKVADVSGDANIKGDTKSDVLTDIISNNDNASRHDVSIKSDNVLGNDAAFKATDVSNDVSITDNDVPIDVSNDVSIKVSNAPENDASLSPEIKVDGVTVRGFDDAETAKQIMIDTYQDKGSYRSVYQKIGVSPNLSSAKMLKGVLDEAGIEHGQKKKVNGKPRRPLKKSLERPIAAAAQLIQ